MNEEPLVALIVAAALNGTIGRAGAMPWTLPSDLRRFRALTMGSPVIMGRKTFDSIGKPLPGRLNIVVTRDYDWEADGALRAGSLEAALDLGRSFIHSAEVAARDDGDEPPELDLCVIGGAQIYAEAMDQADVIHLTRVLAEIDGDRLLPPIDEAAFERVHAEDVPAAPRDSHPTRYEVWQRRMRA